MTSFLQLFILLTTIAYSCAAAQHIDQALLTKGAGYEFVASRSRADALSSRSVLGITVPGLNYESGQQDIDSNSYEYKIVNNDTQLTKCVMQTITNVLLFQLDYGSHDPGQIFFTSLLNIFRSFSDSSQSLDDVFDVAKKFSNLFRLLHPKREAKVHRTKRASVISRIFSDLFKITEERVIDIAKEIADKDPDKTFLKPLSELIFAVVFNRNATSDADYFKGMAKIFLTLVESDRDHFGHGSNYLLLRDFLNDIINVLDGKLSPIVYTQNIINLLLRLTLGPTNPLFDQLLLKGQTVQEIHKEIRLHWLPLLQNPLQLIGGVRNGDQEIPDSLRPLFQIATPCLLDFIQDALNLFLTAIQANCIHIKLLLGTSDFKEQEKDYC